MAPEVIRLDLSPDEFALVCAALEILGDVGTRFAQLGSTLGGDHERGAAAGLALRRKLELLTGQPAEAAR